MRYHKHQYPQKHLIDSLNIIYTIPEEQHKCKVTKKKLTIPRQNKNTEYLNKKQKSSLNQK